MAPTPELTNLLETLVRFGARDGDTGIESVDSPGLAAERSLTRLASYLDAAPTSRVDVPWLGGDLELFGAQELSACQAGYAYNAVTGEPVQDWRPEWIAIGTWEGDAIIADTTVAALPILWAVHGIGTWRPKRVAPSLTSFLKALSAFTEVLQGEFHGEVFAEDHSGPLPALLARLKARLGAVLPSSDVDALLAGSN